MDTKERMEREISFSDLFWGLLLRWRRILCLCILMALLFGILKYVKDMKDYRAVQNKEEFNTQEQIDNLKKQMSESERKDVEDVKDLQDLLEQNRVYTENSKLININPYEEQITVLQYFVDTGYTYNYTQENHLDYTPEIITAYSNFISSDKIVKQIVKATDTDIEDKYIKELISTHYDSDSNIFLVTIIYDDSEVQQQIADVIKNEMADYSKELEKLLVSHTLQLLSETTDIRTDQELAIQQKNQQDALASLKGQLNSQISLLTENQSKLLELMENSSSSNEIMETDKQVATSPGFSYKYIILGAVLGIFVAAAFTILQMVISLRVQSLGDIAALYDIKIYGIVEGKKKKKLFSQVDNLILKWKNRHKKQLSFEQQMHILCSRLIIDCEKENIRTVFLTGSEIDRIEDDILKGVEQELKVSGIKIHNGTNINYDAQSLKEMTETGNVVFIEQSGLSLYQEIANELKVAKEQEIHIFGIIMVQ